MRTTIDAAGRIVIPKQVRDAAGLAGGAEVDVAYRDGRIEIEPAGAPLRLVPGGAGAVIEPGAEMPALSADDVRDALDSTRR